MVFALKLRKASLGALQAEVGFVSEHDFGRAVQCSTKDRDSVCSWFQNVSLVEWGRLKLARTQSLAKFNVSCPKLAATCMLTM